MDTLKLIKELHSGVKESGIKYINQGGCGYFAFCVSTELTKRGLSHYIKEGGGHYWLEIDGYAFDAQRDGVASGKGKIRTARHLRRELKKPIWNDLYNSKHNKALKNTVQKVFESYDLLITILL